MSILFLPFKEPSYVRRQKSCELDSLYVGALIAPVHGFGYHDIRIAAIGVPGTREAVGHKRALKRNTCASIQHREPGARPMTAMELQDAGRSYMRDGLPDPSQPAPDVPKWVADYDKARTTQAQYLKTFETSPTPVFKAMAEAHRELTLTLKDPARQYETFKAAIEDFSVKAKAAFDAIEKAKEEGKKSMK
jgi:hypothetical protein